MKIVLLRKIAEVMAGVDVRGCDAGDVLDLPLAGAVSLIAERWAIWDRRMADQPHVRERRRIQTAPAVAF